METIRIHVEAQHNSRVVTGLLANEDKWTDDIGFAIHPRGAKDYISTELNVDLGRYDSEGDAYIIDLLGILPGDLYITYEDA